MCICVPFSSSHVSWWPNFKNHERDVMNKRVANFHKSVLPHPKFMLSSLRQCYTHFCVHENHWYHCTQNFEWIRLFGQRVSMKSRKHHIKKSEDAPLNGNWLIFLAWSSQWNEVPLYMRHYFKRIHELKEHIVLTQCYKFAY